MKLIPCLFLVCTMFVSCEPEPSADLKVEYRNTAPAEVTVDRFIGGSSERSFHLGENQNWTSQNYTDATGGDFESLFGIAVMADSIVVLFNDTLRIVHVPFTEASGNALPFEDRTDLVFVDNLRSLQTSSAYTIEENESGSVMAVFTFTEGDLEYAISVYE